MDIPLIDMVRSGVDILTRQIAGETAKQRLIYPAKLMLRESTGPRRKTAV
jgi:DNA-binding LacI/PurR family transcriptional regulator